MDAQVAAESLRTTEEFSQGGTQLDVRRYAVAAILA